MPQSRIRCPDLYDFSQVPVSALSRISSWVSHAWKYLYVRGQCLDLRLPHVTYSLVPLHPRAFSHSLKFAFLVSALNRCSFWSTLSGSSRACSSSETLGQLVGASPNFFSRPFRLFPSPTNCPWVSEDGACYAWIENCHLYHVVWYFSILTHFAMCRSGVLSQWILEILTGSSFGHPSDPFALCLRLSKPLSGQYVDWTLSPVPWRLVSLKRCGLSNVA